MTGSYNCDKLITLYDYFSKNKLFKPGAPGSPFGPARPRGPKLLKTCKLKQLQSRIFKFDLLI